MIKQGFKEWDFAKLKATLVASARLFNVMKKWLEKWWPSFSCNTLGNLKQETET